MKRIMHSVYLCVAVLALIAPQASAATISHTGFTNDATSQISNTKTYTHAVDFGNQAASPGGLATVNGVNFVARSGAGMFATGGSATIGTGWSNIPSAHHGNGGAAIAATGGVLDLVKDFNYNNTNAQIRLSGLTVGQTYDMRLYHRIWGGNRTQNFSFTTDPNAAPDTISFNPDSHGGAPVNVPQSEFFTSYQYTAMTPYLTIDAQKAGDGTYHAYGLTNEIVGPVVESESFDLFNTGVTASGAKAGSGTNDLHFKITELGGVAVDQAAVVITGHGAWVADGPAGKYISAQANRDGPGGITTYETTFDLESMLDPTTAQITGFWASDNQGVEILLNGTVVHTGNSQFSSQDYFSIDAGSPFVTGLNTLAFRVNNGGQGPMGLLVTDLYGSAQLANAVPEPTTATLALLGLGGLMMRRRRNA